MRKKLQDHTIKHYNDLFKKFGIDPASLGEPKGRSDLRFQVMTEIGELNNSRILDVGCGFGFLIDFLNSKKIKSDYLGIDINSEFIEIAKKRNPTSKFKVRDIQKNPLQKKFDWIFGIGLANLVNSYQDLENLMTAMYNTANKGIVMNFITNYVDFKVKGTFYTSPEKIFKIAKKFSKRVTLRHDYLPYEFCVYIYKKDKIKKSNNTFLNYSNKK